MYIKQKRINLFFTISLIILLLCNFLYSNNIGNYKYFVLIVTLAIFFLLYFLEKKHNKKYQLAQQNTQKEFNKLFKKDTKESAKGALIFFVITIFIFICLFLYYAMGDSFLKAATFSAIMTTVCGIIMFFTLRKKL